MKNSFIATIDSFRGLSVAVVGESIVDSYLNGKPSQLCREAPVPAVSIESRTDVPGGAANTAVNAAALGARVQFLSVCGEDEESSRLRLLLGRQGIGTAGMIRSGRRRTLTKNRVLASSQMLVRFDQGSTAFLDKETESELARGLQDMFCEADAVILSDYGYGLFTPRIIKTLSALQTRYNKVLIADSRSLMRLRVVSPTAVKPNYEEAVSLLGIHPQSSEDKRASQISTYGNRLLSLTGARLCAVTLDRSGAIVFERDSPSYRTYSRSVRDIKATGAGDTFTCAFTLALAAGMDGAGAAELASAAASVVTAKDETASCSSDELKAFLSVGNKFIADNGCLASLCSCYRKQGKRIVFTNGCFDILHRGHITHLDRAKALGDILIVGVNSDESVARVKGTGRPINRLTDRISILSALSCVDHIAVFDTDTSEALIRTIWPHVFAKGGTYDRSLLPETPLLESMGIAIEILPLVPSYSTDDILRHASTLVSDGPHDDLGKNA